MGRKWIEAGVSRVQYEELEARDNLENESRKVAWSSLGNMLMTDLRQTHSCTSWWKRFIYECFWQSAPGFSRIAVGKNKPRIQGLTGHRS